MTKLRLFALMIAILFLVGCQGAVKPTDSIDITGIYYLVKVDEAVIPAAVAHDGVPLQVRSGVFFINADGTCFSRTHFTPTGGDEITRESRAQYKAEGNRLVMQWEGPGAGTTEGSVDGDTFIMDNHGMIFVYTRR